MRKFILVTATALLISAPAMGAQQSQACQAFDADMLVIATKAMNDAVAYDKLDVHGVSNIYVKRFRAAKASAVLALMDLMSASDRLGLAARETCR